MVRVKIKSQTFWQQHVNEWSKSNLTRAQYCRQHELKYGQFCAWVSRVHENPDKQNTFVPIEIKPLDLPIDLSVLCTLTLRDGTVVKVHDLSVLSFILDRTA